MEMAELRTTRSRHVRITVWVVVAAVVVITASVLWVFCSGPSTARYQPLISAIAANQLSADDVGRLALSGPYAGLTPHNEMFLMRRADGSFLALVPTFYPKGPAIIGLLYTSRPFGPGDTFGHGLGIDVVHPFIKVGPWGHLRVDGRIDDHWYKVSQGIE